MESRATMFKDREEAARRLLGRLWPYRGKNPLVLGIPKGAMPMAKIIAENLMGELGAVLVHKIPAPENEELAVASIGLSGTIYRNPTESFFPVSESYLKEAAKEQLSKLRKRQERYHLADLKCEGRTVILVDDGIATGATAIAAIHEVRSLKPEKLVLAAGVVAKHTAEKIRPLVDDFAVLLEPDDFFAVGQFFMDFSEVTEEEVEEILRGRPMPGERYA